MDHIKIRLLMFVVALGSCACSSEAPSQQQDLSLDGGDCVYYPEQTAILRYVSAEAYTDNSELASIQKYRVSYEMLMGSSSPENRIQRVTALCKEEFETKKETRARVIKESWGSCPPIGIKPLDLSEDCANSFQGSGLFRASQSHLATRDF